MKFTINVMDSQILKAISSFDLTSSKIVAAELGLKDTFLRTWNFVLNYHWSLNIQFN